MDGKNVMVKENGEMVTVLVEERIGGYKLLGNYCNLSYFNEPILNRAFEYLENGFDSIYSSLKYPSKKNSKRKYKVVLTVPAVYTVVKGKVPAGVKILGRTRDGFVVFRDKSLVAKVPAGGEVELYVYAVKTIPKNELKWFIRNRVEPLVGRKVNV